MYFFSALDTTHPFKIDDALTTLKKLGKPAKIIEDEQAQHEKQLKENKKKYQRHLLNTTLSLLLAAPLMIWSMTSTNQYLDTFQGRILWAVVGLLSLSTMIFAGHQFFNGMIRAARHGHATMDTLVALSTSVAWLYSMVVVLKPSLFPADAHHLYFEASVTIIGLINLGQALELRAKGKASQAIHHLTRQQAKSAHKVMGGKTVTVNISSIMVGDTLRVKPGEIIPADGYILEGSTAVNESMLTGEALPTKKEKDSEVAAGTLNTSGSFIMFVQHIGRDTQLGRIITAVKTAQSSKMPIAHLADKVSSIFVPIVIALAILTAVIWYAVGPDPKSTYILMSATAVLIIACPCALGLATPVAVMQAIGKAAEYGILVKNGQALQIASQIDTFILDKTGTLTEGKPRITHTSVNDEITPQEGLHLAASLEAHSEHPLAHAFLSEAEDGNQSLHTVTHFKTLIGYGIQGHMGDDHYLLGNAELMQHHQVDVSALNKKLPANALNQHTPVYLARKTTQGSTCLGLFTISDPVRSEAKQAINTLKSQGINVMMLTGDTEKAAAHIASQTGISSFTSKLRPEDKANIIKTLQQRGKKVAMCGDGMNDAPALAQADVSFALTQSTDTALETATIALTHNSLHGLADTLRLSKATLRTIKQNLVGAFVYNAISIPIAAGALYPITGMLFNPMIASAAMALSSVTVVTNANRLRCLKLNRNAAG